MRTGTTQEAKTSREINSILADGGWSHKNDDELYPLDPVLKYIRLTISHLKYVVVIHASRHKYPSLF